MIKVERTHPLIFRKSNFINEFSKSGVIRPGFKEILKKQARKAERPGVLPGLVF
jgi:hypothetical protein